MRGMSPAGSATPGHRAVAARSARAPPAVMTATGRRRATAASNADTASTVSPEYDETRTRASDPATPGNPYPRCTTTGMSRSAAQAARRSPPDAEPPIPATTTIRGRRPVNGGLAVSVCAVRHCAGNAASAPRAPWGSIRASASRSSRLMRRSLAIDIAMDDRRRHAQLLDRWTQLLDEGDRAVSAAGAPDGDRQIRFPLAPVGGQHELQEIVDAAQQLAALLVPHDELPHFALAAVEWPQLLDEMGIG